MAVLRCAPGAPRSLWPPAEPRRGRPWSPVPVAVWPALAAPRVSPWAVPPSSLVRAVEPAWGESP
eukprot:15483371-Alexandrium_andersonii.AAC.1